MEELELHSHEPSKEPGGIKLYRRISAEINAGDLGAVLKTPAPDLLYMSRDQLRLCAFFYMNIYSRTVTPSELMLADGYCRLTRGSAHSLSPDELLLNDQRIAELYARLMWRRRQRNPDYVTRADIAEIFEIATESHRESRGNEFRYSELDVFTSDSDENARLTCLSKGCDPIFSADGICVGAKLRAPKNGASSATAVVYLKKDAAVSQLESFLSSPPVLRSSVVAELCPTDEIFTALIKKYEKFTVSTDTLPSPHTELYSRQNYFFNGEMFAAEVAEAFLTDALFGERVILLHGDARKVSRLCILAEKCGLGHFNGIRRGIKKNIANKPLDVPIDSRLFRSLADFCDNLKIKLEDRNTSKENIVSAIPSVCTHFQCETDSVFTATVDLGTSPLPFNSGLYAVLAPVFYALEQRKDILSGELSVSVKASLSFDSLDDQADSLSSILGVYAAISGLSLTTGNSFLRLSEDGASSITVAVHDLADHTTAPECGNSEKLYKLIESSSDGIPDLKTISSEYNF